MKKVPEDLAVKLRVVSEQFLALGPDGRLDQVAADAGIPRATLYYYFSGKDDLLTFFMREKMARIGVRVQEAKASDGTAIERFTVALGSIVRELAANPAVCVNLTVAMGRMEAMAEVVTASDQAVIAPLRELLIEARAVGNADVPDIDLTAAMVLGGITMAVIQRYSMTGEIDADALAAAVTAQVMNGVRVR
jgi:AcrR family transcriptional regulator